MGRNPRDPDTKASQKSLDGIDEHSGHAHDPWDLGGGTRLSIAGLSPLPKAAFRGAFLADSPGGDRPSPSVGAVPWALGPPLRTKRSGPGDLFRIVNMRLDLVQLAGDADWARIGDKLANSLGWRRL